MKSRCTDRQLQSTQANYGVFCDICKRSFRREGDKKRHKCTAERKKPIAEQVGATHCQYLVCSRWFQSKGGFALHKCSPVPSLH